MSGDPAVPEGERQPVLRVRKDAERDVPVYSRHDAAGEAPVRRGRRGILGRGRFSLFPILLLALGAVVVFRILPSRDRSTASVDGLSMTLRAYAYKETVLVSISFSGRLPENPMAVSAVCSLEGLPDPLPLSGQIGEGNRVLRGRMDGGMADRILTADMTAAGFRRTLIRKVQRTEE